LSTGGVPGDGTGGSDIASTRWRVLESRHGLRSRWCDASMGGAIATSGYVASHLNEAGARVGTKKTGKGRRKLGRKKRRMRSKIRHRKK
jgi:hypothetical protein